MLPSGTRFGPYEITALLGAGGMGEVYRAPALTGVATVSPDGQRFLVIKEPAAPPQDQNFVVVLNFTEELKQKVH